MGKTMAANAILCQLKGDPDFILSTDIILELSSSMNTKTLCLLALEDGIKVKGREERAR